MAAARDQSIDRKKPSGASSLLFGMALSVLKSCLFILNFADFLRYSGGRNGVDTHKHTFIRPCVQKTVYEEQSAEMRTAQSLG